MSHSVQYSGEVRVVDFLLIVRQIARGIFLRPGCT
jgi:hypothetical protein